MALIPDFTAAIGQTIFGTGGQPFSDPNRVPMTFTSLKRLRLSGLLVETGAFSLESQSAISSLVESAGSGAPGGELIAIEMAVNPNSIGFRQPKRITKRDIREGSVFFHFTNTKGENNDVLTLQFRGNTGNLDIRGDLTTEQGIFDTRRGSNTGAFKKLLLWHNLWALTREPLLLEDNIRNEFLIFYSSVGIPLQISLIGHFNEVLEFTEVADKPFTRDYSFSFTVQEIVPPIEELPGLVQSRNIDVQRTAGQT